MLKEIVDMKTNCRRKNAKTRDTKQVNLTNVRSGTDQVVSSSFTMNLSSEYSYIYVKYSNWKVKSVFNNEEKGYFF